MASRTPARDKILDAAARLFYTQGMTATGVDTITSEAGVARMSLYNNFGSKDDLIEAYIRWRHEEWLELYEARLEHADTPKDKVMAVFDAYGDHASAAYDHGFRGCGLLNAAAELPADAPGRGAVRRHKEEVEAIIRGHLSGTSLTASEATSLARHLSFLLEGAVSRAGLEGAPDLLDQAASLAEALLPDGNRPVVSGFRKGAAS